MCSAVTGNILLIINCIMAQGLWVLSGVDYGNCASKNQCCKETCGMNIAVLVLDHQCICLFMEMYVLYCLNCTNI